MKSPSILDLILIVLFVIHDSSKCQTQVKKLPPRLPKTATLPLDPLAGSFDTIGENFRKNIIAADRFLISSKCNNELELDEKEAVLITTPNNRNDMTCKTMIRAMGEEYILSLEVHNNNLKFGCSMESLNLTMDFTSVLLCRGGSNISLRGKNLVLTYKRIITERFGSFVLSVISKKNSLENIVSASAPYVDRYNCGLTAYSGSLRKSNLKEPFLQPRIIGGEDAIENEFPWMAYLLIRTRDDRFSCGGTLISDEHVLTAAHCLPNDTINISVTMGRQNLVGSSVGKTVLSNTFKIHELFDEYTIQNDISLIKLPNKIDFSDSIKPICLPASNIEDMTDEMATVIGFGDTEYDGQSSDTLQVAKLKIWEQTTCRRAWTEKFSDVQIMSSHICALGMNMEDTCLGDSGGPIIAESFERKTILGITSFGDRCSVPGMPGIYTRVSEFTAWLDKWMDAL